MAAYPNNQDDLEKRRALELERRMQAVEAAKSNPETRQSIIANNTSNATAEALNNAGQNLNEFYSSIMRNPAPGGRGSGNLVTQYQEPVPGLQQPTRQSIIANNTSNATDEALNKDIRLYDNIIGFFRDKLNSAAPNGRGGASQNPAFDNSSSPIPTPETSNKLNDTSSVVTSPLTQSPAPITQQAMSGVPDLTTQPSPLAPPKNVNQASYGGISQPWMYTGANDKVIGLGGTVQPSLATYPDANGDKTMRRFDGGIWTTADSNNLIKQQMAANNTPEAQAYDIAMRNRVRADNGQAPIESPFDKQAQGINSKEQLAMAKLLQDQQQFSETQDNKMRDEIYKGAVAAFGNDETINSAYGDKRISTQQFGAISSIADPQKRTEALQRMQDAAEKANAERKKQEEEDKGRRLSAQARSDARRKNTMANLSSLIG